MNDELVECYTHIKDALVSMCLKQGADIFLQDAFIKSLSEFLDSKNSVMQIRALELALALRDSAVRQKFDEAGIYQKCVDCFNQNKGDILALLNIVEVYKSGVTNPIFVKLLQTSGLEAQFNHYAKEESTDLYLRRDVTVLLIAIQRAKPNAETKHFQAFYSECKRMMGSFGGEEFDAGVEIAIHLFDIIELLDQLLLDEQFKMLLVAEKKKDQQREKMSELKLHLIQSDKYSLKTQQWSPLSFQHFCILFRLFYGKEQQELQQCIENLLQGCYVPFDTVELSNLRVLRQLVRFDELVCRLFLIKEASRFSNYLNTLKSKSIAIIDLKREIKMVLLEKAGELKAKEPHLQAFIDELKQKDKDMPEINTEAQ